tara:strand:+ start:303 stop:452 length:150 start_codon:yes stop_codon:yes gene_type:complete
MFASLGPFQQLFYGVSLVAVVMTALVAFMVSSSGYENTDRLKSFFKDED